MLPPEIRSEIDRAMTELQATGTTTAVVEIPGVGRCSVQVNKLPNGNGE
jgi:hypothetical protein